MDIATRALFNSVAVMVLGAIITFAATWFWFLKNQAVAEARRLAEDHAALSKRVIDLENQLSSVKQAVQPISAAFQAILIKELTHFHTPELDGLLARVGPPSTLSDEEEARMAVLLTERVATLNSRIDPFERDAALMLPMVLRRTKGEIEVIAVAQNTAEAVDIAIVATPAVSGEGEEPQE